MAVGEIENLEVLDENGKPTGKYVSRKEAHSKGIPHAHMAVVIRDTSSQKILIQKRSTKVEKYPGFVDLLSGHIKKGKTAIDTLVAECDEEAGVDASKGSVHFVSSIPRDDVTNNGTFFEKGTTELYVLDVDLSGYKPNKHDDEVDWLGLVTLDELKILHKTDTLVPRPNVWESAFKFLEKNFEDSSSGKKGNEKK